MIHHGLDDLEYGVEALLTDSTEQRAQIAEVIFSSIAGVDGTSTNTFRRAVGDFLAGLASEDQVRMAFMRFVMDDGLYVVGRRVAEAAKVKQGRVARAKAVDVKRQKANSDAVRVNEVFAQALAAAGETLGHARLVKKAKLLLTARITQAEKENNQARIDRNPLTIERTNARIEDAKETLALITEHRARTFLTSKEP